MPHSSGGGSHGGGSHGGSHGGSRGGGGSSVRRSHSYFPGAHRYRYTHRGRTKYVYSDRDPSKSFSIGRLLIGIFYIPFFLVAFAMLGSSFKGMKPCSDKNILIDDTIGVVYDMGELQDSLDAFMDKSGITPAFVTLYNESWQNSYSDLESYAYDRYVSEFSDEKHWLIVYSQPKDRNNPDWFWEGMQGDETDGILTSSVTGRFNADLQKRLENSDGDVGGEVARAFDNITPSVNRFSLSNFFSKAGMALFMLAFVCFHAYFMLGFNDFKYRNAELDDESAAYSEVPLTSSPSTESSFDGLPVFSSKTESAAAPVASASSGPVCDFCGGTYTPGAKRCPHCMAKLDDRTL